MPSHIVANVWAFWLPLGEKRARKSRDVATPCLQSCGGTDSRSQAPRGPGGAGSSSVPAVGVSLLLV